MSALAERGRAIGEAARARLTERVRGALAEVPGVTAAIEDGEVVLRGRRLGVRAMTEPALRWVAGLLR